MEDAKVGYGSIVIFTVFVLLTSITLMNMLIGVLCEVVTAVGTEEKEKNDVSLVKSSLLVMLKRLDADGSGQISKDEYATVCADPDALNTFESISVDQSYLMDLHSMTYHR